MRKSLPLEQRLMTPEARAASQRAARWSVLAGMLWLPMAWFAAKVIAGWLEGAILWTPALIFLALGALRIFAFDRADAASFIAGDAAIAHLRKTILERALRRDVTNSGGVTALAAEKLDILLPWATRYRPAFARVRVLPLLILAVSASFSWAIALIYIVAGPIIPMFMALIGIAARDASRKQLVEMGDISALVADRLGALVDARLLGATDRLVTDFADRAKSLRERTMAVLRIAFLSSTVLELFSALGVAMVAVWTGFAVLGVIGWGSWGVPITPHEALFLLMLAPEYFQPLRDLSAAWHDKASADALANELEEDQALPATLLGDGHAAAPLSGAATISWRDLHIAGHELPDFDLSPGASLALVAPSGAGKTTLLRILAGLVQIERGQIAVAGQPLDAAHADAWRARIGWLPQKPRFGGEDLSDITDDALRLAAADQVVARLPDGLHTRPGETGAGLSGGEARRISLARAISRQPDWLFADEPTADLDAQTARQVTEGLLALRARGTGLIVATHDRDLAQALGQTLDWGRDDA